MANNVEGQRRGAANDEKLAEVVHGRHDTGCEGRMQFVRGHLAEVGEGVDERNEWYKHRDGKRRLVEQELRRCDREVINLLANPSLVESGRAKCHGRDDKTSERGAGRLIDSKRYTNAGSQYRGKHPTRDGLAKQEEVYQDDGRCGHDLGELVETDRVEGQTEVAEHDVADEEGAYGEHLPRVQADVLEGAEGCSGGYQEDETGRGEMPGIDHELAFSELRIAECPSQLSEIASAALLARTRTAC